MQRNGQNPIRAEKNFGQARAKLAQTPGMPMHTSGVLHCPSCHAEVPPKPGFRTKSLTCPKCGSPMHK